MGKNYNTQFNYYSFFIALYYTSIKYSDVLSKSNVEIPIQNLTKNLRIKEEPPVWFAISDTSIFTYKAIDNSEKRIIIQLYGTY